MICEHLVRDGEFVVWPKRRRVEEIPGRRLALAEHQIRGTQVGEDSEPMPVRELAALGPLHAVEQHHGNLRLARRDPRASVVDQPVDLAGRRS